MAAGRGRAIFNDEERDNTAEERTALASPEELAIRTLTEELAPRTLTCYTMIALFIITINFLNKEKRIVRAGKKNDENYSGKVILIALGIFLILSTITTYIICKFFKNSNRSEISPSPLPLDTTSTEAETRASIRDRGTDPVAERTIRAAPAASPAGIELRSLALALRAEPVAPEAVRTTGIDPEAARGARTAATRSSEGGTGAALFLGAAHTPHEAGVGAGQRII